MAPFTGDGIVAGYFLASDIDAATGASTDDDTESDISAPGGAVGRFGDDKAVSIIRNPYLPRQGLLQISVQGFANKPSRIGIFLPPVLPEKWCREYRYRLFRFVAYLPRAAKPSGQQH